MRSTTGGRAGPDEELELDAPSSSVSKRPCELSVPPMALVETPDDRTPGVLYPNEPLLLFAMATLRRRTELTLG